MQQIRMAQVRVPHSSTPPTPRSTAKMPRSASGLASTGSTLPTDVTGDGEGGCGTDVKSKSL